MQRNVKKAFKVSKVTKSIQSNQKSNQKIPAGQWKGGNGWQEGLPVGWQYHGNKIILQDNSRSDATAQVCNRATGTRIIKVLLLHPTIVAHSPFGGLFCSLAHLPPGRGVWLYRHWPWCQEMQRKQVVLIFHFPQGLFFLCSKTLEQSSCTCMFYRDLWILVSSRTG